MHDPNLFDLLSEMAAFFDLRSKTKNAVNIDVYSVLAYFGF